MAFTIIITLLPQGEAADRPRAVRALRDLRAGDRPDHRRLSDRNFGWQYIFYVNLVPGALMVAMLWFSLEHAPMQLGAAAPGRLAGHRHDGDRACGAADRAGGRQQGRLVRLALHRPAVASLPLSRSSLFIAIELTAASAAQSAPARAPQFRPAASSPISCWAWRFTGRCSSCRSIWRASGLQCRADRHGAGLDRAAAAAADPAGAAADAALRRPAGDRRRVRPVRGEQLHERPDDQRHAADQLFCRNMVRAIGQALVIHAAVRRGDRRHRGARTPVPPRRCST